MEHELVTIVVPIFNVEPYLNRCISSIVNQTYRNLEIILVDDGSQDACPHICDEWAKKDNRIKVVHKTNEGLGMARNTGIENASGDYICFFDSDDYVDHNLIKKSLSLSRETGAEIVVFGMNSVDRYGNISRSFVPKAEQVSYTGRDVTDIFLPDLIDGRHCDTKIMNLCLSAWSCLFSMQLIHRTEWKFVSERQNISEDSYSIIWLYQYVKTVAVLEEPLYFYCENDTSLTRTYREDRYERVLQFYRECTAMANQVGYDQEIHIRISGLFLSFSIAAMKQIVTAKIDRNRRRLLLSQIIDDETMQAILKCAHLWSNNKARKYLFMAMQRKMYVAVYLLIKLQKLISK